MKIKLCKQLAAFAVPILLLFLIISIYTLNINLSFISIIKLLIVVLMIIFHLYLIHLELNIPKEEDYPALAYKQSGSNIIQLFKQSISTIITTAGTYITYITVKCEHIYKPKSTDYDTVVSNYESLKSSLSNTEIDSIILRTNCSAAVDRINIKVSDYTLAVNHKSELINTLTNLKAHSREVTESGIQEFILIQIKELEQKLDYEELNIRKLAELVQKEIGAMQESLILDSEATIKPNDILHQSSVFNLFELFDSFDGYHKLAACIFMFNSIIASSVISIGFVLYGDHLISKFNLEIRFPKLARIIQLRRKYQKYYLIISMLLILYCTLVQMILSIAILAI